MFNRLVIASVLALCPTVVQAKGSLFNTTIGEVYDLDGIWKVKLLIKKCGIDEKTYPEMEFLNTMLATHRKSAGSQSMLDGVEIYFVEERLSNDLKLPLEKTCHLARKNPEFLSMEIINRAEEFKMSHLAAGHATMDSPFYALAAAKLRAKQLAESQAEAEEARKKEAAKETPRQAEERRATAAVQLRAGALGLLNLFGKPGEIIGISLDPIVKGLAELGDSDDIAEAQKKLDNKKDEEERQRACLNQREAAKDMTGLVIKDATSKTGTIEELGKSIEEVKKPGAGFRKNFNLVDKAIGLVKPVAKANLPC